jgi:chorismate mutase-like protein
MWGPIFEQNRKYLLNALSDYGREHVFFVTALRQQNYPSLEKLMSQANQIRKVLEKKEKQRREGPRQLERFSDLRSQIESIDRQLILLLKERMKLSFSVGELKKRLGLPVLQKKRWASLLAQRKEEAAKAGLDVHFIEEVFEKIHLQSLKVQRSKNP